MSGKTTLQLILSTTERMMIDKRNLPTLSSLIRIDIRKNMDGIEKKMYLFSYIDEIGHKKIESLRYSWFTYDQQTGWHYQCEHVK